MGIAVRATRSGNTLLEITIAVGVLGLAIVPLLGMFTGGVQVTRSTLDEVLATSYSTDVLEQLEVVGASRLPEMSRISTLDGTLRDGAMIPGGSSGPFHLAAVPDGVMVTARISTPTKGVRRIVVDATPRGRGQAPFAVRLESSIEEALP